MRQGLIILSTFISTVSFGQMQKIAGTYSNIIPRVAVTFNDDSTFQYITKEAHPTFYRWEDFSEKGKWTISGDTIILNPNLTKKVFVESGFTEAADRYDSNFLLTFNHIKRYIDQDGNIVRTDTFQIDRLDYSFNTLKKKYTTRISPHTTQRCAFAGYIPKEVITTNRTISISRPTESVRSIFIGCYELQGTKEFFIKDPTSNHLTFNVYSNYYQDGQIRQMKFLIKNENALYTRQKPNGEFEKDKIWCEAEGKLKKQKGESLALHY